MQYNQIYAASIIQSLIHHKSIQGGDNIKMYRRIRDLRNDNDMTQKELSKILGMSQTGYSKYETGENDIPTEILIKLSKLYNVSIDYLLDQTNCKKRYK